MWTYSVETGMLLTPAGNPFAKGYSGANPGGLNDPDQESIPDIGPIPQGLWTVGAPVDDPNTGPYTLPLTPQEGTETFGRTEFRCHGDSIAEAGLQKASHGCIILPRFAREAMWNSPDHDLKVVAE